MHIVACFQVFLFNTNNRVSSNYFYLITAICLQTVIWIQVNNNNPYLQGTILNTNNLQLYDIDYISLIQITCILIII